MDNQDNLLNSDLQIDDIAIQHLKETTGWAKFLGVVGFVFSGFIAIAAFVAGATLSTLRSPFSNSYGAGLGASIIVIYLLMAGLTFMISLFVYRFGSNGKAAINSGDQSSLNDSLKNLKFVFRTQGIITCIYLGILVLVFLFGGLAAMMR
jgi:hypothetical protein